MPDPWSRHVFHALCRRYGMKPYRYYRQRHNTVMVRVPKRFLDQVLWTEFSELDRPCKPIFIGMMLRVIREVVVADAARRRRFRRRYRRADALKADFPLSDVMIRRSSPSAIQWLGLSGVEVPRHELADLRDRPALSGGLKGLASARRMDRHHSFRLQKRGADCQSPTAASGILRTTHFFRVIVCGRMAN